MILKLSHYRHTGRHLPHHHTSYAALSFVVLMAGVLLSLVTGATLAVPPDSIEASGVVTTSAPVITAPIQDQVFTAIPVTVSGTCAPDLIVTVFKNDAIAGSAVCQFDGKFNLQIDLFEGTNQLSARHYRPGPVSPVSNAVTVHYNKPTTAAPTPTPPAPGASKVVINKPLQPVSPSPKLDQLLIVANEAYKGGMLSQELAWPVRISGGQAPYALNWEWGDGSSDLTSLSVPSSYTGQHIYKSQGTYRIVIKATDSQGNAAYLQVIAVIRGPEGTSIGATKPPSIPLMVLWPLYLLIFMMLICFWLGERYELWSLNQYPDRAGLPKG